MWVFIGILIAVVIHVGLTKLYKRKPPVLIEGAWIIASINVTFAWSQYGDLQAMGTAAIYGVLLALLHGLHWAFTTSKSTVKQVAERLPQKVHIDDTIYDQIAEEMSQGAISTGLMTRAIAEADGDPNRAQAIYIKLRAAAILAAREATAETKKLSDAGSNEVAERPSCMPFKEHDESKVPPQNSAKKNPLNEPENVAILIFSVVALIVLVYSLSQ